MSTASHDHDQADDGAVHAHVSSTAFYVAVFLGLLFLTGMTVGQSYVDLGKMNIILVILIATMKASLVVTFFMHLKWDNKFNALILISTIFFIGVVLSIMVLPIVTALSREVFAQTPTSHREAALALGATTWETVRTAVLPFGKPGVISAAMLALGRALGETIAVTFIVSSLAPGTPWTWSLFNGGETFASRIANNAGEFDSAQKTGAFIAAGLVLFILTFLVNAVARIVIQRRVAFSE